MYEGVGFEEEQLEEKSGGKAEMGQQKVPISVQDILWFSQLD